MSESTMSDARGNRVPTRYVPTEDKKRDRLVRKHFAQAMKLNAALQHFKSALMADTDRFVETLKEEHNIQRGGKKGNLTFTSFDGSLRFEVAQHDSIQFNEKLKLAQDLISQWIRGKANGVDVDLQKLIDDAFYAVRGTIRTSRILGLLRLDIKDESWQQAMKLIRESIQVSSSKEYIRFYQKGMDGTFRYLPLDISNA
ncbi:MAG: DUF3164 family protein [Eubacteriales bacterium]|nr:DUF3164 family protein [Eubacteriales bacterium]